jgi:hypothetical protein
MREFVYTRSRTFLTPKYPLTFIAKSNDSFWVTLYFGLPVARPNIIGYLLDSAFFECLDFIKAAKN